ncbi:MAG: class I SAM-dependent methyltransferase [bacterium]
MHKQSSSEAHAHKTAERFDEWAENYADDRISKWFQHYQQTALNKFNFSGTERFLDVGCGTGWAVRYATESLPQGSACGIDISSRMIEKATHFSRSISNCEFSVANSESIPYEDEFFDSVLCTFSFHHYQNPLGALAEIRRVMKPDGAIVIVDSARDVSFPIWLQDRGRRYFERSHVKYYSVKEMRNLVEQSGLKLRSSIHTENGMFKFGKVFTGLMLLICERT